MMLTKEQQKAYEWAKQQNYSSVAAQYAKIMADAIDDLLSSHELTAFDLRSMDGEPVYSEAEHKWFLVVNMESVYPRFFVTDAYGHTYQADAVVPLYRYPPHSTPAGIAQAKANKSKKDKEINP